MAYLTEFQADRSKKGEPRNALLIDQPNKNPKTKQLNKQYITNK